MLKKRIHINESQLYRLVKKVISEDLAGGMDLQMSTNTNTAIILYNAYKNPSRPSSPIRGFNEKIIKSLLDSIRWEFIQYEGIMEGYMSAEVEGTADDGNIAVGQMYANIYVDPQNRTVKQWAQMWTEDCVALRGGQEWEPIEGSEVRIDKDGIARTIDDVLERFVKKGGLDKYLDEDY